MTLKTIGLDTAKHVFQVHGLDEQGRAVLRERLRKQTTFHRAGSTPSGH